MDKQTIDSVKRLLIRLEDARQEVQHISYKMEYPATALFERAYDAIHSAEKYLKDSLPK